MSTRTEDHLALLLRALRAGNANKLERLAADLIGRLVNVRISTAKAGFQHGGDAGTTGRGGRHLRLECKRYADTTPLGDRELQGELDDALRRNPALEAWVLVATREVTENTQETLNLKARKEGVPIVVIDWASPKGTLPDLAALCAWASDLVEVHYGEAAAAAARALASNASAVVERIQHELEPWKIGYEQLRSATGQRVLRIWNNEADSSAALAQNAAGGAASHFVRREAVLSAMHAWWALESISPAVVFGAEGTGKTWAVLHWVLRDLDQLPITLTLPASAFLDVKTNSESGVIEFLARAVLDATSTQDQSFWDMRLRRLLQSPASETPVVLLLIDGLNQEPSYPWLRILQILQGGIFRGRVRLILTTQSNYLEQRLDGVRTVAGGVVRIGVEPYDTAPGGELEQMLAHHGRTLASLAPELVPLARVPRLFPLVMKLSSNAELEGDATLTRLLWAYGRDELGLREGRAFTEIEWEAWLLRLARSLWAEIQAGGSTAGPSPFSLDDLDRMVTRQSLEPSLNYRRLQEIIDGTWMEPVPNKPGSFRPKASTVHLALGATLLQLLEDAQSQGAESVDAALESWLDPVAATSAAADILAAAMSIAVAKRLQQDSAVANAIVIALLRSQNAQDTHRQQLVSLAPAVFLSLLNAVERCGGRAFASTRHWALASLRQISPSNIPAWSAITERLVSWVAHTHCPNASALARKDSAAEHEAKRLITRIGIYEAGTHRVMGVPMRLHERGQDDLAENVPTLLLGKPLVPALRVFEAAAVAAAIDMSPQQWEGFKWLITLNPVDPVETTAELARLSDTAFATVPETGVHPEMPKRVAALLLWLSGTEEHERDASVMRVSFEGGFSYEEDYLPHPTRSLFVLERRHVDLLWDDNGMALLSRIQKATPYLPDPKLAASKSFVKIIEAAAAQVDVSKLDTARGLTSEDHAVRDFTPGAARFAPAALADLATRWFAGLSVRTLELRHWAGLRAPRYLLLADSAAAKAARDLRINRPLPGHEDESYVATQLLKVGLFCMSIDEQLDSLVESDDVHLMLNLLGILKPGDSNVLMRFLDRWGASNQRALEVAFNYMAAQGVALPDDAFATVAPIALGDNSTLRIVAFIGLERANPVQFGEFLLRNHWCAAPSQTIFEQDHGSRAVLAASSKTPLTELKYTVAPWCLLTEARRRGGSAEDAKVAARAIGGALNVSGMDIEHPDVDISIDLNRSHGLISFEPPTATSSDNESSFQDLFDSDARRRRREQAYASGHEYLSRARDAGAVLAVQTIEVDDARMLVDLCSAEVELWLDGYEHRSSAFRQRVNLAGGLFLSLCEALLEKDWQRGVELWHAINECLRTTFSGVAGVNDLVHMPFRTKENPGVLVLRDHLYSLARNQTDKSYLEIVICAIANAQLSWLVQKIAEDEVSGVAWRRKRAIFIQGLIAETSALTPSWSTGPAVGLWDWLRRRGDTWTNNQAFARHWWREFLVAETSAAAFAAWRIFLICADRRVLTWMNTDAEIYGHDNEFGRAKLVHVEVNWSELEAAMREKESKGTNDMDKHLLGWRSPANWFESNQLADLVA